MRNRHSLVLLVSIIAALTISVVPAFAQGRGGGHGNDAGEEHYRGHGRNSDHRHSHERHNRAAFGEHDSEAIVAYYRDHRSRLPRGLAKREELPPGLERQLRRNGRLPPGLQKRVVWFPADLDRRLGPLPDGYRRCWVGGDVLIVNPRTFRIFDVMVGFSFNFH